MFFINLLNCANVTLLQQNFWHLLTETSETGHGDICCPSYDISAVIFLPILLSTRSRWTSNVACDSNFHSLNSSLEYPTFSKLLSASFLVNYSRIYTWCSSLVFCAYFFEAGQGGVGNYPEKIPAQQKRLKKKSCKRSHGKKTEQVLSTILVLCVTLKRFLHKLLSTKNNHA